MIQLSNNCYYILIEEKSLPSSFKLHLEKDRNVNPFNNLFYSNEKENKNKVESYRSIEYLMQFSPE